MMIFNMRMMRELDRILEGNHDIEIIVVSDHSTSIYFIPEKNIYLSRHFETITKEEYEKRKKEIKRSKNYVEKTFTLKEVW